MITKLSVEKLLETYANQHDDIHLEKTLSFVSNNENLIGRNNLSGHLTGSAWILNSTKEKALLIHHKKLGLWFQPGGHIDDTDFSIKGAAQREAIEETGLKSVTLLREGLFDLDVHFIPERKNIPGHWHYDFRFVFVSESEESNANFSEVNDIKWFAISEILDNDNFGSIKRMALKSKKILLN